MAVDCCILPIPPMIEGIVPADWHGESSNYKLACGLLCTVGSPTTQCHMEVRKSSIYLTVQKRHSQLYRRLASWKSNSNPVSACFSLSTALFASIIFTFSTQTLYGQIPLRLIQLFQSSNTESTCFSFIIRCKEPVQGP